MLGAARAAKRNFLARRGERGFTLVELLMAMFVIAVVIIAIITVQARALVTTADAQARQAATAFANEAMEQLRAMPWFYLSTGLYSGFNSGGTDPFVSGSTLTVDGRTYNLLIGSGGADQTIGSGNGWPPLFDDAGSNVQVEDAPSGNGDTITVRSYTTDDQAGSSRAVGLVVVATWTKKSDGSTENTVLTSTAYAPSDGCGDLTQAPYLAACQARFEATGSTAIIDVAITASTTNFAAPRPLVPGSPFYLLQLQTSSASSRVVSQQVSTAQAFAQLGGVLWDDANLATDPLAAGFTLHEIEATDDSTSAIPSDPAPGGGSGSSSTVPGGILGGNYLLDASSDSGRTGTVTAKATEGCPSTGLAAVPAGAPCATSVVNNSGSEAEIILRMPPGYSAGVSLIEIDGDLADNAWTARFPSVAGNASLGCQVVTGSGCVAGGAQKRIGDVVIGDIRSGSWQSGGSQIGRDYLVRMTDYADSVRTERGVGYETASPISNRSASISYWDGSGFDVISLGKFSEPQAIIPAVTWSNAGGAVTADGTITMTGAFTSVDSSPSCKDTGCSVSAGNGVIEIEMNYRIQSSTGDTWTMTVKTTITGSDSGAIYTRAASDA